MVTVDKIINGYKAYSSDEGAVQKIRQAFEVAHEAHAGQFRKSGEPFIVHPVATAKILVDLKMDSSCICAALLHDTIEDTDIELDFLRNKFGREIASMVDSLTKIKTNALVKKISKDHDRAESMRKIVLGMAKNVRVIIIKLADRWNNIQTLNYMPLDKRKQIARETMTIYAPIADKLGLSVIRRDLKNLSFSYIDPKTYQTFERRLAVSKSFLEKDAEILMQRAKEALNSHDLDVEIYEQFKTPYGLYQQAKQNLPSLFLHLTVLTSSPLACYKTLGILHEVFTPLPGTTIRDYISIPRTNGYQALHTILLFNENVYPIQIRTHTMEQVALYGVLQSVNESSRSRYRGWIKHLKEWVQDESDSRNIIKGIEDLAEQDTIYVCTPQGDYLGFPRGSIVLDFAYRIHTDIGHTCQGALVNEKPTGIFEELQDGTLVEIIHSEEIQIQSDWITHVKTPRSHSAICNWLDNRKKVRSREFGRKLMFLAFDRLNINLDEFETTDKFLEYVKELDAIDPEDLYFKLGRGIITLKTALKVIFSAEEFKRYVKGDSTRISRILNYMFNRSKSGEVFQIKNIHDPYLKYSLCCNPLPGEDIIGILSIQHGLSVHCVDCQQLKSRKLDEERLINLEWGPENFRKTSITINIECQKRIGIATKILSTLEAHKVSLLDFQLKPENNIFKITIDVLTDSAQYSDRILRILKNHKGIIRSYQSHKNRKKK